MGKLVSKGLLCEFAHSFPDLAARILHRDRHKRRNFREETVTDLLMAGLTCFEPFGLIVDFPFDESKTGEDMDWEFVDPSARDGHCYLRLHIQAKRAISSKTKNAYWYYRELDHAVPKGAQKGTQHKLLMDEAAKLPGCVPLYMFYHTRDALKPKHTTPKKPCVPAIDGVNLMFADRIPVNISSAAWPVADKKLEKWRPHFFTLADLLCRGGGPHMPRRRGPFPSPGEVADRLAERIGGGQLPSGIPIKAIEEIPQATLRAIARDGSREVERPRAIFVARWG